MQSLLIVTKSSQNFTIPFRNAMFSKIIAQTSPKILLWKGCLSQRFLRIRPRFAFLNLGKSSSKMGPLLLPHFVGKTTFSPNYQQKPHFYWTFSWFPFLLLPGSFSKKYGLLFWTVQNIFWLSLAHDCSLKHNEYVNFCYFYEFKI